ncbi:hypothetical protein ABWH93_06270 [Seohaeicola saemankumensis]|uniref:hypothetical protein n=1 Tax=Seohaeicola saemankumensis TaxID=481181 RepID=UPI0035D0BCDD
MLRLNLSTEPRWLDLGHGVRLLVEPLSTAIMLAARSDPTIVAAAADTENCTSNDDLARIVAKAVARIAIKDWDGVGDEDGQPLVLTPDGIDALLELWPIFEAFQTKYIAGALILDAEKNASPPLPIGNSAGAATTAKPVHKAAKTARRA